MWISRVRSSSNAQLAANARLLVETLRITAIGRSREIIESLVEESRCSYEAQQRQRTTVHSADQDGYWTPVGSRPIRPLSTVVLPRNKACELLADCREFLDSEDWYAHHGIPYRRGYLLYGPPGTGKTSLVMSLAGELRLDIYVVTLSSPAMGDETLRQLLNTAAPRSILLLEDVDAAFLDREAAAGSKLTFSGLLNAIDGVAAQEGRLLFMTTNHIERLNSALIRPGRVDYRLELTYADRYQTKQLFINFYRDLPHGPHMSKKQPVGAPAAGHVDRDVRAGSVAADKGTRDARGAAAPPAVAVAAAAAATDRGAGPPSSKPDKALKAADECVDAAVWKPWPELSEAELEDLAEQFAQHVPEGRVSMAQLQGFLMQYKKDPWGAVKAVKGAYDGDEAPVQSTAAVASDAGRRT